MDAMIRPVQYARALDGKLVAVEQGPHSGFAIGDTVYATHSEANAAAGRINQQCYLEMHMDDANDALWLIVQGVTSFDASRERITELVDGFMEALFPRYSSRSEYASRFVDAMRNADDVYREMKAA